jgi:CheY-like chemotaxis protein/anti-sigma regulatory factor (Ser/Thr protein kinase)
MHNLPSVSQSARETGCGMPTILIVDDCSIDRRLVGGLLCCVSEWQLQFANDGLDAWQQIQASPPDVVVTDLQMPRMDGLQLVRCVKGKLPNVPVILITSQGSQPIALLALREGAAHFTPKRWLARDLVSTIRQVLGISQRFHPQLAHDARPGDVDSGARGDRPPGGADLPKELRVDFELENDDRLIGRLIEFLQDNLPGWAESDAIQIAMALHEAITNAMHHGNLEVSSRIREACETEYVHLIHERKSQTPYADRRVRISAHFLADQVVFDVTDQGPGFDPAGVADPTTAENLEKLSGRGLLLIRSFMDQVIHNDLGNRITMIKRRRGIDGHPL